MSSSPGQLRQLQLPSDESALSIVARASCAKVFYSVDRAGLPPRGWAERLDQKLMGDLATATLEAHIKNDLKHGTRCYDEVRSDQFKMRDPGWDIAVRPTPIPVGEVWREPWRAPENTCTISVKSSRVPASDRTIEAAFEKRDFKILAYAETIAEDLHADFEIQLYFDLAASRLDNGIAVDEEAIRQGAKSPESALALMKRLDAARRFSTATCVGLVTSQRLAKHVDDMPAGSRKFRMPGMGKWFWKAPLKVLASPLEHLPEAVARILAKGVKRPTPIMPE